MKKTLFVEVSYKDIIERLGNKKRVMNIRLDNEHLFTKVEFEHGFMYLDEFEPVAVLNDCESIIFRL